MADTNEFSSWQSRRQTVIEDVNGGRIPVPLSSQDSLDGNLTRFSKVQSLTSDDQDCSDTPSDQEGTKWGVEGPSSINSEERVLQMTPSKIKSKAYRQRRSNSLRTIKGKKVRVKRGSVRSILAENSKLRQELEEVENSKAEIQVHLLRMANDFEDLTNENQFLKNQLTAWQRKHDAVKGQLQMTEKKMEYKNWDIKEKLDTISSKSNNEIANFKETLYKEVHKLSQELEVVAFELSAREEDLICTKKQLNNLKKNKDDERESLFMQIQDLQRIIREVTKEKNKYRIDLEDASSTLFSLRLEFEETKSMLDSQKNLVQAQREELEKAYSTSNEPNKTNVLGFQGKSLAAEMFHSETVIKDLREENQSIKEELVYCQELLENTWERLELCIGTADNVRGEALLELKEATEHIRGYLRITPPPESKNQRKISYSESHFDDENFVLNRKSLDDVILGSSWEDDDSVIHLEGPGNAIESKLLNVSEEVSTIKEDMSRVIKSGLEEINQQNKNNTGKELKELIESNSECQLRAMMDWMEKAREKNAARASEYTTDFTRLKQALLQALAKNSSSNEKIVSKMGEEIVVLKNAQETSTAKLESLERQQSDDKQKTPPNNEINQILERLETFSRDHDMVVEGLLKKQALSELSITYGASKTSVNSAEEYFSPRIHRLATLPMTRGSQVERRDCVSQFLLFYSNFSNWRTETDSKLRTTVYVFKFGKTKFRTRMSFLYPFVNYLTQVIGVNKAVLGTVSIILPTTSINSRIKKMCSCFDSMHKTLGIHNSENLWNYVYIFIENMSTHYREIQPFIGSRTRTNRPATSRRASRSRDDGTDENLAIRSSALFHSQQYCRPDESKDANLAYRSSPLSESLCYRKPADIRRYASTPTTRSAKISSGSSAISSCLSAYRYRSGSSESLQMQDLKLLSNKSSKRLESVAHSAGHPSEFSKSSKNRKGNDKQPNNRHRRRKAETRRI